MHPETEETNCGMYRVQLLDRHKALLRCLPGSGGDRHLKAWHERGLPMPVTIALGGPPALTWAASVSLPDGVDEMDYVGYLSGEPVPMLRCQCSELAAPAAAEIIIEGKIWPAEEQLEGPFGNHTGSYSPAVPAPVIRVEKVLIRPEAIYPCTVVGPPPMENIYLAQATQQMLLPLLQHDHPWVMAVHMPVEGIFHRAAMVVVDSDCSWSLDQIRSALVTSMLLKKSKLIILLDEDVPRGSLRHVYWHIVNKMKCTKDADGVLIDARTPSGWSRVVQDPDLVASVNKRWSEFGL